MVFNKSMIKSYVEKIIKDICSAIKNQEKKKNRKK